MRDEASQGRTFGIAAVTFTSRSIPSDLVASDLDVRAIRTIDYAGPEAAARKLFEIAAAVGCIAFSLGDAGFMASNGTVTLVSFYF